MSRLATSAAALLLAVVGLAGCASIGPSHPVHAGPPPPRTGPPVVLGAFPGGSPAGDPAALHRFQRRVGVHLGVVRVFDRWDSPFPTRYDRHVLASGARLLLSVRSVRVDGVPVAWHEVATAPRSSAVGHRLVSWARRL